MPLEFRRQRDGRLRDYWFGSFAINGKRYVINLGVKIAGTPPASLSLKDRGDTPYEVSRAVASAKLQYFIQDARKKAHTEHLLERLYEIKTGETIRPVLLSNLPEEWGKIARKRKPADRYASQCKSTLKRFATFVNQENGKAVELAHVTRKAARSFMDAESSRGVTAKTWNDTLKLLRATFKHLLPGGSINPFAEMPTRETETVFRQPFTPEELAAITEAARADEFIRPIIIVGMCTAMRRGDCCLLKWEDVDMNNGFITVKTSKTGQTVTIPIFPMLFDELTKRKAGEKSKMDGYVFPEVARMYLENPDGITWRVKKVLAAGLGEAVVDDTKVLLKVSDEEARKRGEDFIAKLPDGTKRERMGLVFKLYMEGTNIKAVMAGAKVSKGSVSGYLNEIQTAIGCRVVRGANRTGRCEPRLSSTGNFKAGIADVGLQVDRKHGLRRASVRDFHSLRVTWVTLALTAGVPLELVQKVTGHKTTAIVLKHYFQPGQEAFRQALQSAMPKLLTNGQKSPKDEMQEILSGMTQNTWKKDKERITKLLAVF